MRKIVLLYILIAVVGFGCSAFQQKTRAIIETKGQDVPSEEYIIGPEDQLHISVWKDETLTTDAVVRSDGKISVPLINDVQASGLTSLQLKEAITESLREFVPGVEVTVIVQQMVSNKIYVQGEVTRPGPQPFNGNLTVIQALAQAGGLTSFAERNAIIILRMNGEQMRFKYNQVARGKNLEQNIQLQRGDTIIVP